MARSSTAITSQVATSVKSAGKSALASEIAKFRARKTSAAKKTPATTANCARVQNDDSGQCIVQYKINSLSRQKRRGVRRSHEAHGRVSNGARRSTSCNRSGRDSWSRRQRGWHHPARLDRKAPFGTKEEAIEEAVAEAVPLFKPLSISVYSCAAQPPRRHSPIPRGGWVTSNNSLHQLVENFIRRSSRQRLMGSNHIVSQDKLLYSFFQFQWRRIGLQIDVIAFYRSPKTLDNYIV